ncbi:MAG: DUF664 domain-containing protein [Anaerolineales bacterium]|nr:DUF664 domain-containing protein [Anaerolineales bacterium]
MADKSIKQTDRNTIDTLFRHNLWANTQLFEVCAGLDDQQLEKSIVGTYGSIRETLKHIANSEYSYWHRIKTGQPFRGAKDAPSQTIADLQTSIQVSGKGLIEIAPTVEADDSVEVDWDGTPRSVPCTIILTQAINHATEHRAQIMATLTQLGTQPPDLDGWSYLDALDRE